MGSVTARRPPGLFCLTAALALATSAAAAQTASPPRPPVSGNRVVVRLGGEYRLRLNMMSDIPLRALPRTDPAESGQLGQRLWGEQWLRLRSDVSVGANLHIIGQMDVLHGLAFGDLATGVAPEARIRGEYGYPGVRLRWLYLDWETPIGLLRVGQMGFSWGLGIVANDGDTPVVFGDYQYGDLVRRVMLATRPLGRSTPFVVAVGGDWIVRDQIADLARRDETALQGIVASYYGDGPNRVGAYGVYRWQENALDDTLSALFVDVYARWGFRDSAGGRIYGAVEAAYATGSTTYARTTERPEQSIRQLMAVLQVGRTSPKLDVVLEGGYASGDSNTEDAIQGRATIDPDHRVGLILFPEVMAAQSARSAYLAQDPALGARPARGSELLPTNGGVSGAAYLFPYAIYRPKPWLELRLGGVFAMATADVVDPFAQRAYSRAENPRGGPSTARDLGIEVDGAVLLHGELSRDLVLSGGVEGGVFVAGSAFDDAAGQSLGPLGLVRFRVGLRYR
ncbi:MAG: hypothetical protein Q8S73_43925 [Deltaproteobacteria bacterium]|nr:hypothetical protein [Myxococcales bacterium]MDP3221113.1 hypothetical protein [Deltaproteobacteria bacterium]